MTKKIYLIGVLSVFITIFFGGVPIQKVHADVTTSDVNKVCVQTANVTKAGTDNSVYLNTYDNSRNFVRQQQLDDPNANEHDSGDYDCYSFYPNAPERYFSVSIGGSDAWFLSRFLIVYQYQSIVDANYGSSGICLSTASSDCSGTAVRQTPLVERSDNPSSQPTNGQCSPTHYDCSAGTGSNSAYNANTNIYTWNCNGTNGGNSASCSEQGSPINPNPQSTDGQCDSPPTHYNCSAGNSSNRIYYAGTGIYTWDCNGTNGGNTDNCTEQGAPINPNPPGGTCSDNIQNQGETGVDTGGPCGGGSCSGNQVMCSGSCKDPVPGTCKTGAVDPCTGACPSAGPQPQQSYNNPTNVGSIEEAISAVTFWLYVFAVPLLSLMILWGAFLIMTSGGVEERYGKGVNAIKWGVIGFIVILLAGAISAIVRSILG